MGLKRKADDDDEDFGAGDEATKRRQIEELMKIQSSSSSSSSGGASTSGTRTLDPGKRQMQGQSAESGMHSIDSDEEEEYEKLQRVEEMSDDDIEGVEDEEAALEREGEIQITPFNMKDEKEEGIVTKDGNFVFNKKKEELKDSWLDNIDWGKVKERTTAEQNKREEEDEREAQAEAQYNEIDNYRKMLVLMLPKESVARSLIRLGGGKKTTAQKLKDKKRQKEGKETEEEKRDRVNMAQLTGLADAILSRSGHMEIYEETYESIAYKLKQEDEKNPKTVIPEGVDDEDALDMFMETAKDREGAGASEEPKEEPKGDKEKEAPLADNVRWEFRWENTETAEVHGPHTSCEMLKWQESGFFDKGVFVRKCGGTASDFHDGKRIDFDLYV